jgi:hypothetical protein
MLMTPSSRLARSAVVFSRPNDMSSVPIVPHSPSSAAATQIALAKSSCARCCAQCVRVNPQGEASVDRCRCHEA